jgi:HSP20 family protein
MAERTVPGPGAQQGEVGPEATRGRERYARPPVDIYESADTLVLMADLPGVIKESLEVRVEDAVLTIQAKASHAAPGDLIYREYDLTGFFREFQLNEEIDRQKVSAELKNGVLTLYLPKKEKAKPRQIEVKVN